MIELKNIKRYYEGDGDDIVKALDGVSLTVEEGEMVAVMGASGSGKSTLLNVIGALDKATDGEYRLDGVDVGSLGASACAKLRNENFGFVIQDFAVVADWTVFRNVQLPLLYSKKKGRDAAKDIDGILERLGIAEKRNTSVNKLSGGQQQRVAIARAVVNSPRVILADEPTGALDSENGAQVIKILKEINETGTTVIIVTHNPQVAAECGRVIYLKDGRVESDTLN